MHFTADDGSTRTSSMIQERRKESRDCQETGKRSNKIQSRHDVIPSGNLTVGCEGRRSGGLHVIFYHLLGSLLAGTTEHEEVGVHGSLLLRTVYRVALETAPLLPTDMYRMIPTTITAATTFRSLQRTSRNRESGPTFTPKSASQRGAA
ncbi:uncharacterized protein [Dermacentor albipictus]|uniref:uncharacterized protein isoform X1 n=1 Tax=Dermacentor albipictus TaxID=60249 RepID=UPI0038FD1E8D